MKLSSIEVDPERIEQGEWVKNIPDAGDLELRVRGLGNADFRRMQTKLTDAVPRSKKAGGRIDPDEQDRIVSQCLAATVLLDWRGLEDDHGPMPFSKERARELLMDPRYRRFRDAVIWAASVVGEEQAADLEEAQGN